MFKVTVVIVNTIIKAPTKLFFHSFQHTCYCELYQFGSCTPTRRSRTETLWARGALPHASLYTNTISMYSLFENKRAIFTKF
jgi:predicted CDP-diglyceride synthetase/phosphatidate cytidylyltransferase